ncbi:MAG: hypothetical protein KBT20_02790 [Bacteroidales bacterium]|nr:hypothetical protein [Candidatus Liminaster caballi]
MKFIKQYIPFILALLPMMFLRDFTPSNELRYISVAVEALREGRFFALTHQGEPYVEFPPLYFWLLMVSKVVFRHWYMIQLAMFSLIPSLLVVQVMHRWVWRYEMGGMRLSDGSQSRDLAQWMLFTCGLMFVMSFYLRMDMLLCLWVVLALYNFWQILFSPLGADEEHGVKPRDRGTVRYQFRFGLFVLLAVLTKGVWGLVIPLLVTTSYLVLSGRGIKWFRVWGWRTLLVLASGIGVWLGGAYLEGGQPYIDEMLKVQPYHPLFISMHHVRPWFYYIASVWYDSLPWGPLCMLMLVVSIVRRYRSRADLPFIQRISLQTPLQNFFALTFLSTLIMLSCIPGKIDVRLLPVFPFLIYVGVMQMGQWRWPLVWQWRMLWVCRIILIVFFILGCLAPTYNAHIGCYGHVCWRARGFARELGTEHYYAYHLPQMGNMDVYLHEDPIEATDDDFRLGTMRNTLLITNEDDYHDVVGRMRQIDVPSEYLGTIVSRKGPYVVVKFE